MTFTLYTQAPDPNGTDDTAALQAVINSAPNDSCILFPSPAEYKISSPLQIYSKSGLCLRSLGQPDVNSLGHRGTEFVWIGTNTSPPDIAVINLNFARRCILDGLAISCDFNSTPPAAGIRIDQWTDNTMPAPTIPITSTCVVQRCLITAPTSPGTFNCLDFSLVGGNNVDVMTVDHCVFAGGAIGIHQGNNINGRGQTINRCQFNSCLQAIYFVTGSMSILDCTATACGADVRVDNLVDFGQVRCWNSKNCSGLALSVGGSVAPFEAHDCRWFNMLGTDAIFTNNQPSLALRGCYLESGSHVNLFQDSTHTAASIVLDNTYCNGLSLTTGQFTGISILNGSTGF